MKRFAPDTNFFFECRKANDLTWLEIAPDVEEIELIVPPTVITEIERHKKKGNSRTAKRARETSALLRDALNSRDQKAVLRSASPKVFLALPPVFAVQFDNLPQLDRGRPDHCIVAELAKMRETWPDLELLTDDTLSALAARSIGLSPVMIPESWKLSPEKDERDDEIETLRNENRVLKSSHPELTLAVLDAEGNSPSKLKIDEIEYFLSAEDEESAVASVRAKHPMKTDFKSSLHDMATFTNPPTSEQISKYRAKYSLWVESVRSCVRTMSNLYSSHSRELQFAVELTNAGFANAENVRLSVEGFDGIWIASRLRERERKARQDALELPSVVEPPKGRSLNDIMLHRMGRASLFSPAVMPLPNMTIPEPEDSNSFYYIDPPFRLGARRVDLRCALFPHQGDSYTLSFRGLMVETIGKSPRIKVRVEASNLKKPVERTIAVEVPSKRRESVFDLLIRDGVI